MTYMPDIKLLTQKPVLYAIYDDRDVVSYGVGEGAARLITKTVITMGINTGDLVLRGISWHGPVVSWACVP